FSPPIRRHDHSPFTFLFAARLLWDKGVGEFVDAAQILARSRENVRFHILGMIEPPGRSAVPREQLQAWDDDGIIKYLGSSDDVREAYTSADCLVLPS